MRYVGDEIALHLREPHLTRRGLNRQADGAEEHDHHAAAEHHVVLEGERSELLGSGAEIFDPQAPVGEDERERLRSEIAFSREVIADQKAQRISVRFVMRGDGARSVVQHGGTG